MAKAGPRPQGSAVRGGLVVLSAEGGDHVNGSRKALFCVDVMWVGNRGEKAAKPRLWHGLSHWAGPCVLSMIHIG